WTLTGLYEESIGYRYFYTLRQLYDADPYVFLPQGQLMDLANQLIQFCLTVSGHAPTELFPRIDLFSYASLAFAFLLATAAFSTLLTHFRSVSAKTLAALWFLIPYYSPSVAGAYVILQPDYHNWILPVGLIIVMIFARWDIYSGSAWTHRQAVLLAAFA